MISKECFTTEWIAQKSKELQYNMSWGLELYANGL